MIIGRVMSPEEFKGKRADVAESLSKVRPAPDGFTDHVFKTEHGVDLGARVWPAPDTGSSSGPRPFVTWTHGGAFVGGNHYSPLSWLVPGFHALGYHVVSNAYRLCPQVDLEGSIEDCVDFIAWCRRELPAIIGHDKVDVDRYVITGESGGGYMVTNMATRLPAPAPRAVVDVYGAVDLFDPYNGLFETVDQTAYPAWGSDKDDPLQQEFSEERLLAVIRGDRDQAHAISAALFSGGQVLEGEEQISAALKAPFPFTERVRLQAAIHSYLSSVWPLGGRHRSAYTALFHPERFAGEPGDDEQSSESKQDAKVRAFARTVSPMQILDSEPFVSGTKKYPPTAFLHGSADVAVPLSATERFAAKLQALGVETLVSVEPDEPHVFDQVYTVCSSAEHEILKPV
ncbi:hypothetical protein PG989_009074 [Apiospora arundinis]